MKTLVKWVLVGLAVRWLVGRFRERASAPESEPRPNTG
jgi:hypothetical protein